MRDMVPAGYEFISSMDVVTGLRVNDASSTLNGTTFQCIAFTPLDTSEQNDSAAAVTLEVGGECRINLWCTISCIFKKCHLLISMMPVEHLRVVLT